MSALVSYTVQRIMFDVLAVEGVGTLALHSSQVHFFVGGACYLHVFASMAMVILSQAEIQEVYP